MRASWPSFLCEPLKRVAELSRSWLWLPSDPDPPEACVGGRVTGSGSTWGGQREEAGVGPAEAVAGAGPRRAKRKKLRAGCVATSTHLLVPSASSALSAAPGAAGVGREAIRVPADGLLPHGCERGRLTGRR